jgi:hypothetical protein
MKKIFYLVVVLAIIFLFGRFCYNLAALPAVQPISSTASSSASTGGVVLDLDRQQNINQQIAGVVLPGSKLYSLKLFGEKLHLYFTKSELASQELKVAYLNRRLAEAQVLLETGRSGQAQQMVNQFAAGSEGLMTELKKQDYLRTDPDKATALEQAIGQQIDLQKSLMVGIGSSSPLYMVKARILKLELELADTPQAKKIVSAEQARDNLARVISATKITATSSRLSDWAITQAGLKQLAGEVREYFARSLRPGWAWTQARFEQLRQTLKR